MAHATAVKEGSFLAQVIKATPGGERLLHCLQCGSCGGSCPSGADMQYTPRTAVRSDQCRPARGRACRPIRCGHAYRAIFALPAARKISPLRILSIRLKRISIAEGMAKDTDAPALAKTFTDLLDKYGRSFEFGLASRFYLFNKPLAMLKMGPMGLSMFTRGRMALTPTKIKKLDQLQAIIKKAREIGARMKDEG